MKNKNSKATLYICAVLCVCVVFFITACSTRQEKDFNVSERSTNNYLDTGGDKESGNEQKVLKLCSSTSTTLVTELVNDFSNRTGIIVELEPLAPEPLSVRLRHVKESDSDIWLGGSAEEYYIAGRRNMLRTVHPSTAVYIPARFRDFTDRWLPLWVDHISLLSNKEKMKSMRISPPESWSDLLQPVLYSEIVMAEPHRGGASYGMITSIWQWNGEKQAMQYASDLRTQKPLYTTTREEAAEAVISGKCSVAVLSESYARELEKNNRNLCGVRVKSANKDMLTAIAVLKSCKNTEAADKFMHYIFTDDAAAIMESYDIMPLSRSESDRNLLQKYNGGSVQSPKGDLWWMADKKKFILRKWYTAVPDVVNMSGTKALH